MSGLGGVTSSMRPSLGSGVRGMPELLAIGATVDQAEMIVSEVAAAIPFCGGALERDDFWAVALMVTWETLRGGMGGGYLRVRVRGALRDLVKYERRAVGDWPYTVRWPVYWPVPSAPVHAPARVYARRNGRWYAARRQAVMVAA